MTPEGKVKDDIMVYLNSLADCWYFKPVPIGYGRKGIPDFIGCYKGLFFSIEAKAPGGSMTPWQLKENTSIECAGGCAIVADCNEMVKYVFKKYLNAL